MKTEASLSNLLFPNQYRRKVLGLLLMQPERWVHLRELARLIGATPGTLKKEVDALCRVGLLQCQRIGNQTRFSANPAHPVFPELQALIRKTIGLADTLRLALEPLSPKIHLAFVFGSEAGGNTHVGSDIDVMIVGDITFAEAIELLYSAQQVLSREINPKVMTLSEWQARMTSGDPFMRDILAKPRIPLMGSPLAD